jgi:hypothetical protein
MHISGSTALGATLLRERVMEERNDVFKTKIKDDTLPDRDIVYGGDLFALRNPDDKPGDPPRKRVFPIEVIGAWFIYLFDPESVTEQSTEGSTYAVAHVQRGITIWTRFKGIEHAREFCECMNSLKALQERFMDIEYRDRIRSKLTDMGYFPLENL